jgi:hypothetical protein
MLTPVQLPDMQRIRSECCGNKCLRDHVPPCFGRAVTDWPVAAPLFPALSAKRASHTRC